MLAQLDPRALQAQLAQAKATQAKDQAQLVNARLDLKRFTQLAKEDAATQQQLDTQRALVAQLEATVQMDEAQVAFAQVQLGYTTITAPIGGRVGARLVDPGNIVHATDTGGLVVINQIDPIAVIFTVPESAVGDINTAMADTPRGLSVAALGRESNQPLGQGKLVLVNNQIDTATGTVQLKAMFPNPRRVLWPGQYVNARLQLGTRKQALTVPAAVVQRGQNGTYAYALDDQGIARIQPIRVAAIQDNVAVVGEGLKAGERVVVDGQYKLRPGLRTVESKATTAMADRPAAATGQADAAAEGRQCRRHAHQAAPGRGPMSLSAAFIKRPIGTSLLALAILLVGVAAWPLLPVAPLPQVDFPTIQVTVNLPGGSPRPWHRTSRSPWNGSSR